DRYEQDHGERLDPTRMAYWQRRLFWSWLLAGGSANYGGRWWAVHPYSQTGSRPTFRPTRPDLPFTAALTGLDSVRPIRDYFEQRRIELSDFDPNDALVKGARDAAGVRAPKLMNRGRQEFLIYHPHAADDGQHASPQDSQTAALVVDLRNATGLYSVEWYRAADGAAQAGDQISGGDWRNLVAPWKGRDCVVRLLALETATSPPRRRDAGQSAASLKLHAEKATGPLRVHPTNPRYFTDGTKSPDGSLKAVYLTGSHTWNNLQDIEGFKVGGSPDALTGRFDFERYLDFLQSYHHNFFRLWFFEFVKAPSPKYSFTVAPHPWLRTGPGKARDGKPRFDLSRFNEPYFARLRARVFAARERGVYVSIMLFESSFGEAEWQGHPFHTDNNINGVNGRGMAAFHTLAVPDVVRLQEAYVRKVIDTVNDLDNVLYEVCNEPGAEAKEWQVYFCNYIKKHEATKPKQHPVGMTAIFDKSRWPPWVALNDLLFNSPADWISPGGWAKDERSKVWGVDPPANDGRKVIIPDPDHIWPVAPQRGWVWKCFVRGHQPILMDWHDSRPVWTSREEQEAMRKAMGHTRRYAERMNLAAMTPRNDLASTQYCLANPGREYLVYLPDGGEVTVDLTAGKGALSVEWFNPRTGVATNGGKVAGGAKRSFKTPFE
ncbi:hypothetical protein FJY63_12655, partial [Candidatus Sumerlaeota bacterium]|nr:hypothetical protein [Candidatus Sumerlaeota bacterium]